MFSQTADRIMQGQIESFLWAFVSITIVMVIALRSIPLGLLSLIPNFVPIAALIGTIGYLDIPLNSFNSMIASIARRRPGFLCSVLFSALTPACARCAG